MCHPLRMATAGSRERVPLAQEKVLISRSGNRCAYPKCGLELTADPRHQDDHPKAIGKVAHICAASPGGPRYDRGMTSEQRGSASNLIYLCGPHHDVVDTQLHFHTAAFLLEAKADHEAAIARGVRAALGLVTYVELAAVCAVLTSISPSVPAQTSVELATPIAAKIALNQLSPLSGQRITDGLSQANRVAAFVEFQCSLEPSFGTSLAARCKSDYFSARANQLGPDEVFDFVVEQAYANAGPSGTPEVRAAALSVVAYLFEICEIFEHA